MTGVQTCALPISFYTARRSDALSVPTEAILTGTGDERYVFVVDDFGEGDTATRVVVQTGLVSKTDTEIVSGLAEGDRVVVKGQSYLADGAVVRVVSGEDNASEGDTAAGVTNDTADAAADGEG